MTHLKSKLKGVYLVFLSLLIVIIHLPVSFASNAHFEKVSIPSAITKPSSNSSVDADKALLLNIFDSLNLDLKGLSEEAFNDAVNGYTILKKRGMLRNANILTIADFSKSSAKKRLFVIDLKACKVLYNTYVAHGQNSGDEYAKYFSNENESLKSSPGFYITSDTYTGSKGYSLHLNGQEKGINDNAYERSIVMHAADYVSEEYINSKGYIGRSWGCPAVPNKTLKPIVEKIKNGTCLFIYTPDKSYQKRSRLANA